MSKLTATAVVKAKPKAKQYKLADSGGMYLLIYPSGSKYWRYDYSYAAKRKTLALGVFPDRCVGYGDYSSKAKNYYYKTSTIKPSKETFSFSWYFLRR